MVGKKGERVMTDKVQRIKGWISKTQDGLMDAQGNFEYPEHEVAYHILCDLDTYIDSLSEEPVSEDLEKTSKEYADKNYVEWLDFVSGDERDDHYPISEAFKAGAQWQKRIDDIIKRNIHNNAVKYGKRQIINAACEYLWRQMWPDNKIDDFRKELEEG